MELDQTLNQKNKMLSSEMYRAAMIVAEYNKNYTVARELVEIAESVSKEAIQDLEQQGCGIEFKELYGKDLERYTSYKNIFDKNNLIHNLNNLKNQFGDDQNILAKIRLLELMNDIEPDNPQIYNDLAKAHEQNDEYETASLYYEKLYGYFPEDEGIQFDLMLAYERAKMHEEKWKFFTQTFLKDNAVNSKQALSIFEKVIDTYSQNILPQMLKVFAENVNADEIIEELTECAKDRLDVKATAAVLDFRIEQDPSDMDALLTSARLTLAHAEDLQESINTQIPIPGFYFTNGEKHDLSYLEDVEGCFKKSYQNLTRAYAINPSHPTVHSIYADHANFVNDYATEKLKREQAVKLGSDYIIDFERLTQLERQSSNGDLSKAYSYAMRWQDLLKENLRRYDIYDESGLKNLKYIFKSLEKRGALNSISLSDLNLEDKKISAKNFPHNGPM